MNQVAKRKTFVDLSALRGDRPVSLPENELDADAALAPRNAVIIGFIQKEAPDHDFREWHQWQR